MRRALLGASVMALVILGLAAAGYVLVHERLRVPFRDVYHVNVELSAADGVAPGLGQPVEIAGVKVGTISGAQLSGGRAVTTLEIDRSQLPVVHDDARAALAPVTPLKDMRIELNPGSDAAPTLAEGATVSIAATSTPAGLDRLLGALDADTRDFVTSLIASTEEGTRGRAGNLRQVLLALGPTVAQAHAVTAQLDRRRLALARLVHNLAIITRAASEDRQLASFVSAGDVALHAIAREDAPLRHALTQLPATMTTVRHTLAHTAQFARVLTPTLTALTPATRNLPGMLRAVRPFANEATLALQGQIRPLVRESRPLLGQLGPATGGLRRLTPPLTGVTRVFDYLVNELAYNPPGDDEGFLFWFPWWFHNYVSMFSGQDAHGSAARAMIVTNCQALTNLASAGEIFKLVLGVYSTCKGGG